MKNNIEILAPAGDFSALIGAISAGADAVYLGTDAFNARMRAKNFTADTVKESFDLIHAHGKRAYVTLNTAIYEKELDLALEKIVQLHNLGADAFIVADFGIMAEIRHKYPEIEIHASTQASVHSLDGANFLSRELGVKRVVLARELDKKNIAYVSKNAEAETEIFVHGAHCMSQSGQCLFSYALGGRSGNRGECAQPCRLPYSMCGKIGYPLSLKDMSLAPKITELLTLGASSLKIEGRMKSEDYVYGTTKIYRDIIDGKRNANHQEISTLGSLFSRQGFTSGYFDGKIDGTMLGVRTDDDKQRTSANETSVPPLKKVQISLFARIKIGERAYLKAEANGKIAEVYGEIAEEAINAPMSSEEIVKRLSKLGTTPFEAEKVEVDSDDGVMIRVSSLNDLRRRAIFELLRVNEELEIKKYEKRPIKKQNKIKTALFFDKNQVPKNSDYFDVIFLPLENYSGVANGVWLPPVIFDSELQEAHALLSRAKADGAQWALISNVGQIELAKKYGFKLAFDYRFNVFNRPCVELLQNQGAECVILSPELSLPQLRDFDTLSVIAYGKLPLMTTHKCVLKDTYGCEKCQGYMKDRQGASFYVKGLKNGHRNIIFNSVPIYMADKQADISSHSLHFIFSDEGREECEKIIDAYKSKKAPKGQFRRIK